MGRVYSVLNLEPEGYSIIALGILESFAIVDDGPLDRGSLASRIKDYDIIIVRLGHRIDREIMSEGHRLKVIVTATTGLNHIDLEVAKRREITVLSLQGERDFLEKISATAEHTWALLLSLARNVPAAFAHVIAGGWQRDLFRGMELQGKTLGIIGFGRLGVKVALYGLAFGMVVIAYDTQAVDSVPDGVKMTSLNDLLARSDIVSLHPNYGPQNYNMISTDQLTTMKNGAYLINTSRGEIVDEMALLRVLRNGHIGGAALDVICDENIVTAQPLQNNPLVEYAKNHSNLILTPHVGGATFDSMEQTEIFMAQKLKTFVSEFI